MAPSLHESHAIAPLEAMSCGKAVITSDISGVRESVRHGENGLLTQPNSPDELAINIEWLLNNPSEAARMGASGQRIVHERFSWERIARQTERVYELAVDEKAAAATSSVLIPQLG